MPVARSRSAALVAAIAAFIVLLGLGVAPASAEGLGASISGHVTDPLGNPVAGVTVSASGGTEFPTTTTDANGDYSLAGLTAGTSYRVVFVAPPETDLVNQFYAGAASYTDATPVVLATDEARTGVDAVLAQGGSVSGTVTNADGTPGAGATIFVIPPGVLTDVAVGRALDDGTYVVHGVPAGSYQIKFEGSDLENIPALWYPGSPSRDDAATITVAASAVTSGIDVVRPPAVVPDPTGTIAGTVLGTDGFGIDGATVTATGPAGTFTTSTFFGGSYSLALPVGTYVVGATSGVLAGFHPDAATADAATPVTVTAGSYLSGTDVTLRPTVQPVPVPRISGRITSPDGDPIAGAVVSAIPRGPMGGPWGQAFTDADGSYTINDVAPGTYSLQARGPYGSPFVTTYYPNAQNQWDGTPLTIDADTHLTGIDVALPLGGTITGTVTVPAGHSLSTISVSTSGTAGFFGSSNVDPTTGTYVITGLPVGTYTVQVSAWGTDLVTGYYPGATTYDAATPVAAVAGATTSGIDFDLVAGGTVSGVVWGPDGPVANASVQVSVPGSFGTGGYAMTDSTGHYAVVGLRDGSYSIRFGAPWSTPGLVSNYFPGVYTEAEATLVDVSAGAPVTADGLLVRSASLSGRVTDPDGNPVTEGFVGLYDRSGAQYGYAGADLDADGRYSITSEVPPGTFTAQVTPYDNSPFPPAYYPGVPTLAAATFLTMAAGEDKTDVDISLSRGAELQLTLKAPGKTPAQGVLVELVDTTGTTDTTGRTDDGGLLDLRGLAAGSRRIAIARASADTPYVAQYFAAPHGTKVKEKQGTLVALDAGTTTTLSATLQTGAKITGVIRAADGTPQANRMVVAFVDTPTGATSSSAAPPLATRSTLSGPDGTYTIQGLLPGSYLVAVPTWPGDVFYGTGTTHGAPNVKVVGTKTTKNIDITIGTTFTDVQPTSPFASDIEWVAAQGILPGVTTPDGTTAFGSSGTVTRGDLAGALFRAAGSPTQKVAKSAGFSDVPTSDPNYAAIVWSAAKGYLTGSTDHGKQVFRPGRIAVRSEAAGALYRFAGSPYVALSTHPAFADVGLCTAEYKAIVWLGTLGVTSGGTNGFGAAVFHPKRVLQRGALAEALHKAATAKH